MSEYIETFKVPSARADLPIHSTVLLSIYCPTRLYTYMPSLVSKQVGPTGFGLMSTLPVLFAIYQI